MPCPARSVLRDSVRGRVQSAFPTCASLWQAELRTHLVPPRGRVGGRLPAVPGLRSVAAVSAASASGPVEGAGYSARVAAALSSSRSRLPLRAPPVARRAPAGWVPPAACLRGVGHRGGKATSPTCRVGSVPLGAPGGACVPHRRAHLSPPVLAPSPVSFALTAARCVGGGGSLASPDTRRGLLVLARGGRSQEAARLRLQVPSRRGGADRDGDGQDANALERRCRPRGA